MLSVTVRTLENVVRSMTLVTSTVGCSPEMVSRKNLNARLCIGPQPAILPISLRHSVVYFETCSMRLLVELFLVNSDFSLRVSKEESLTCQNI